MTFTYPSHTTKGCVPLSSDVTIVVLHKEKPAFLRKLLLQVPNLPKIVDTVCVSRGHSESTDFSMSPDGYQAFHTEFLEICNTFYEVLKGGE